MLYEISNIKILQKLSVVKYLYENTNIVSIAEAKAVVDAIINMKIIAFNSNSVDDMIMYHALCNCEMVFFEMNKIEEEPEPINKSIIGENGNIFNPCGLTQAENWYNELSDDEKINVKHLSGLFFHPACG